MVQNSRGTRGNGLETEVTPVQEEKQATLLKLAERTVIQAEELAQEITENARRESEAEGAKIIGQLTAQANAEAQQIIDSAQSRSEAILSQSAAEARSSSEKMLSKAQSDSEKMLSKAQLDSEKMLSKAQSESEEGLSNAQTEAQEILGRAQQEAQSLINAGLVRADSTESRARLKAEFIIRQTTQNVADGLRSAVLETCNSLLLTLEEFGKEAKESPGADPVGHTTGSEMEASVNTASQMPEESPISPDPEQNGTDTQSSGMRNGTKAKKDPVG